MSMTRGVRVAIELGGVRALEAATLRANSTTASCMPRQIPKKGILFVRA